MQKNKTMEERFREQFYIVTAGKIFYKELVSRKTIINSKEMEEILAFISQERKQWEREARKQTLEEIEKEVIGEDEKITKYEHSVEHVRLRKSFYNELRKEQRTKLKQLKEKSE